MSPNPQLVFDNEHTAADFRQYLQRAKRIDADGSVRLQLSATVAACWVCAVAGRGLLGQGVQLGLRTLRLAEPLDADPMFADWCTPLSAFTDRFAHGATTRVPLPASTVHPPWAALTPSRDGWEPIGSVTAEALRAAALDGIERVRQGEPAATVWATPLDQVTAGTAFAAYALGFLHTQQATVHRAGPWTRLSTPFGHVLGR